MKTMRSVTAAAMAATLLATSTAPAMAQGYPGQGWGRGGHGERGDWGRRHHRGPSAGEVIAGVAVVGVLAAILSAGSKRNRGHDDGYRGGINDENAAADACVGEVERAGGRARVSSVEAVNRIRDGYEVRGTIDSGEGGYGYGRNDRQRFTCTVRYGSVEDVRIDDRRTGY